MTGLRIGLGGFNGRMGTAIRNAASREADVEVVCGVVRPGTVQTGELVAVTDDPATLAEHPDVFIDVSTPTAVRGSVESMTARNVPFISGVTGLGDDERDALDRAAATIPVLEAANFSLGVALVAHVLILVAQALPAADVEIVETHHRRKKDAPSGTANVFAEVIARARRTSPELQYGRFGAAERRQGEIGMHSLRGGGNAGEHHVHFLLDGEEIVIEHRALSRDAFAQGALQAARWLVEQPPGRYSMDDVARSLI